MSNVRFMTPYEALGGARRVVRDRFYHSWTSQSVLPALHGASIPSSAGANQSLFEFLRPSPGGPPYIQKGHLRMRHLPHTNRPQERDEWMLCVGHRGAVPDEAFPVPGCLIPSARWSHHYDQHRPLRAGLPSRMGAAAAEKAVRA